MTRRRSNTITNQFEEEEIQIDTADVENCSNQQTISIILRRTNKVSRNLEMPSVLHIRKLKQIIKKEFYISEQNQILFWRGERIDQNENTNFETLCLAFGDTINVHNKEVLGRETSEIYFQFLNSDFVMYREFKKTINSQSTISNCLSEQFTLSPEEIKNCVCVQSGRFLNISRTFQEEAIEDESLILLFFNSVKGESLPILQEREIKLLENKIKNKRASQEVIEAETTSNFKKKLKVFSCKSMILPESLELIWEEDTSDEYDCKNLAKTFLMKKNEMIAQSECKFFEIEFNDSKSDTSISEKSINFEVSLEETSDFSPYDNEDLFSGKSKNSVSFSEFSSNECFEESEFEADREIEFTKCCPYDFSEKYNLNGHLIFNEEVFLPHLTVASQEK